MRSFFFSITGILFLTVGTSFAQTWTGVDVGAVAKTGSDSYNSATGTYTLSGCGADIWDTADAFHFVYQMIPNSGELVARVVSVQNTNGTPALAQMVRQDTTARCNPGVTDSERIS